MSGSSIYQSLRAPHGGSVNRAHGAIYRGQVEATP